MAELDSNLTIHDYVSLGEIEKGLRSEGQSEEAKLRLPFLLRILEESRSLEAQDDVIVNTVNRIEDSAAFFSVAETIEVEASYMAPHVCKRISKLSKYDNERLTAIAKNPLHPEARPSPKSKVKDTVISDTEMDLEEELAPVSEPESKDDNNNEKEDTFMDSSFGQSKEAALMKTLSEITFLVTKHTRKVDTNELEDSEAASVALTGTNVGASIASLMHWAPVLHYESVANALLRDGVVSAPSIIATLGANAPSSVTSLVSGCLEASTKTQAKLAIKKLAALSTKDSCRIRNLLRRRNQLLGLQLDLLLKRDPILAASLVCKHLSQESKQSTLRTSLTGNSSLYQAFISTLLRRINDPSCSSVQRKLIFSALSWTMITVGTGSLNDEAIDLISRLADVVPNTDCISQDYYGIFLVCLLSKASEGNSNVLKSVLQHCFALFDTKAESEGLSTLLKDLKISIWFDNFEGFTSLLAKNLVGYQRRVKSRVDPGELTSLSTTFRSMSRPPTTSLLNLLKVGEWNQVDQDCRGLLEIIREGFSDEMMAKNLLLAKELPSFLRYVITKARTETSSNLPVIMPLDLERELSSMKWNDLEDRANCALLKLYYSMVHRSLNQDSSFTIDPLGLQMDDIIRYTERLVQLGLASHAVASEIIALCRPFRFALSITLEKKQRYINRKMATTSGLAKVGHTTKGLSICAVSFSRLLQILPHRDVASRLFLEMISDSNRRLSMINLRRLCFDPLILLKISKSIWEDRPLRQRYLALLDAILTTCDRLVLEGESHDETIVKEMRAARNLIILKAISEAASLLDYNCVTTTFFLRLFITRNEGLFSSYLRQCPSRKCVGALILRAPETFDDFFSLRAVLIDDSNLSVTEKLVIGEGVLDVAVRYGQRNILISDGLITSSMAQVPLVIPVIVGPPGIPVTVVTADVFGSDRSKVCRETSLRILDTTCRLQWWRRTAKASALLYINKLIGLAKGEASTSGKVKLALKDIQDKSIQVANVLVVPGQS